MSSLRTNEQLKEEENSQNEYSYDQEQPEETEEDQEEESNECDLCHDIPESIIFLSCEHVVCLICAAKLILANTEGEEPNLGEIKCGICDQFTELSTEVQETLIECFNEFQLSEQEGVDKNNKEKTDVEQEYQQDEDSIINNEQPNEDKTRLSTHPEATEESKVYYESDLNTLEANINLETKQKSNENNHQIKSVIESNQDLSRNTSKENNIFIKKRYNSKNVESENYQKTSNVGISGNSQQLGELGLTCTLHFNEELAYYNTESRKLYCSQCLLSEVATRQEGKTIKPIKKCLPTVFQHFQDMLGEIQLGRSFIENKKKDIELTKESLHSSIESTSRQIEFEFDEIIEQLENYKRKSIEDLTSRLSPSVSILDNKEASLNSQIDFFDSVVDTVSKLRENEDGGEEEIFRYFFLNQQNIINELNSNKLQEEPEFTISEFLAKLKNNKREVLLKSLESFNKHIETLTSSLRQPTDRLNSLPNVQLDSREKNLMREHNSISDRCEFKLADVCKYKHKLFSKREEATSSNRQEMLSNVNSYRYNRFSKSIDQPRMSSNFYSYNNYNKLSNLNSENKSILNSSKNKNLFISGTKLNYNQDRKNDIDRKLKFFEVRSKKEDPGSLTRTISNFKSSLIPNSNYRADQNAKNKIVLDNYIRSKGTISSFKLL